ncbi:phosphoserine phosphatase [Saccharomycopsis crataegensis]|uniref:phosphoserine phosphatase n=1 Tax=Saccharomycopsis crataegensis TaxID=43959 RepID=A0AAV5QIQ9_9ASCO|nr:phosphoserine phosphatase [Saccharomycopsis crataegensis]
MSLYSATIISQGTSYPNELTGSLYQFIEDTPGVLFHSIHNLAETKAIDFIVQLEHEADQKEVVASITPKFKQFAQDFNAKKEKKDRIDLILQPHEGRKDKKLFIFDMDSTLITQEVIEMIAGYAGVEDKVREITEAAMRGELDFNQSLAQRVGLLRGIESEKLWDELESRLIVTPGAPELTKGLKKLGITLGVLSGGFIPLANRLKKKLGLDYAFANNLKVETDSNTGKEVLSGETFGEIVNGDKKAELLQRIAKENGIDVKNAVAVGDGANDLKMMGVAGWGIAWNAKPKVQEEAQCALNSTSLRDVFYILGYSDPEIEDLIK